MKEKEEIDVSIIIVNYNGLDLLDNCLKTFNEFSKDFSYEIIVVDNNSQIGNVEAIVSKYENTHLIKNCKNLGFAAANNQGLEISKGEYVLLLNNDTIFIENTIKEVLDFIKSKDGDVFVGCKLLNQDLSLQLSTFNFPSLINVIASSLFLYKIFPDSPVLNKYYLSRKNISEPVEVDVIIGAFILSPRKTLNKLKGFDDSFFFYSEEVDLCYRLKKKGGKVFFYPKTKMIHLGGASADKIPWFKYRNQFISYIQFYQKHFKGIDFLLLVIFQYLGLIIRISVSFLGGLIIGNKSLIIRSYYHWKQLWIYPKNKFK